MGKITADMVACAYEAAQRVYRGELSRTAGRAEIAARSGMGSGSAGDYITVFLAMMAGECYKRTLNLFATEYYLEHIGQDYGPEAQRGAARAVTEHVRYYQTVHGYLASFDRLARKYLDRE